MLIIPRLFNVKDLGDYEVFSYDRAFNLWATVTANPAFHTYVEHHAIVPDSRTKKVRFLVLEKFKNIKFYVFGGDMTKTSAYTYSKPGTQIYCFDAVEKTWNHVGDMLRKRSRFQKDFLKILLKFLSDSEPEKRNWYSAVLIDDTFLIAGEMSSEKKNAMAESCRFENESTTMKCYPLVYAPISYPVMFRIGADNEYEACV